MEEEIIEKELQKINRQLEELAHGILWLCQAVSGQGVEEEETSGKFEMNLPKQQQERFYVG